MAAIEPDNNGDQQQSFPCQTCGKAYMSVQALGGHQNAHRRERFVLKRRHVEMKRQIARQLALLPRPTPVVGPSYAPVMAYPPPYLMNSMVPPPPQGHDDAEEELDLTLKL